METHTETFYAPWCPFCQQLDPVWHAVGSELKSLGSPVHVGKADATLHTGLAKEFRVRNYPAIIMLKQEVKPDFRAAVRTLSSTPLFQHAASRHRVLIVYVGATSPLKGNFTVVAEQLIVHTYFFSAARDVLPKAVSLPSLPAVVIFKDGTYFTYNEERDGDLKSWINTQRFPNFFRIDSYTLYSMGESGKLVALALLEKNQSEKSMWYKSLMERVSADYKDVYSSEVVLPSFIVVNLSNDGYFLPLSGVEKERHLLDFLNGVLNSSIQSHGGNGVFQCLKRLVYDIRIALTPVFLQAPLLGCFLVSVPLVLVAVLCYLCCKATPTLCDDDTPTPRDKDAALRATSQQQCKTLRNKKSD
ncbi:hypothetical protein LDENG_00069240 [Lucifuga dentata]|nr:hypothetical protein LDENG_00069240 [Lucifuga dentata]